MGAVKGYLTVYVALSLAVLLSLFLAVLEGVRQSTVSLEAEIIADTGLNGVLAEYHRELFDQYNVFFLDTSYGTANPSVKEVENHLSYYLSENCCMSADLAGGILYRDFLDLETGAVQILRAAVATDFDGGVFRRRAIEAVEDDIGISYLQEIAGWLNRVEEYKLGESDLIQEKQEVDKEIASYDGSGQEVDGEWVTFEVENPTTPLEVQTGKGILHLVMDDVSTVSAAGVDNSALISARRQRGRVNQGNWASVSDGKLSEEALLDRILFNEYIMRYCGNYRNPLDKGVLRYQVEYLIEGRNNDIDNLKGVVHRLSALREASNLLYLLNDPAKCAQAEGAAFLAASIMLLPELTPLLKTTILLGWAYAESLYDVRSLLAGGKIPLFKTEGTWHYDISCVLEGILEDGVNNAGAQKENGLDYGEYLRILLLLSSSDVNTFRLMDIIEMDIRQTEGNRGFRMDACIDRLEAQITIISMFGYSAEVRRRAAY